MKTAIGILIALIIIGGAFFLYEKHDADDGNIVATSTPVIVTGSSTPATGTPSATSTTGVHGTPVRGGTETVDMRISSPLQDQTVTSPLSLSGSAKGTWFFEGSAPVVLKDANGKTIAQGHISATGDWMTTSFVPFTGTLTWTSSSTGTSTKATIVFMNDNPSGDPSLQKSVSVPVVLSR